MSGSRFKLLVTLAVLASAPMVAARAADTPDNIMPGPDVDNLSTATKDAIRAYFAKTFVLPQLVLWKWDYVRPYPTTGMAVCGRVNAPSSTRIYQGYRPFYALFQDGRLRIAAIAVSSRVDPVGSTQHAYDVACTDKP